MPNIRSRTSSRILRKWSKMNNTYMPLPPKPPLDRLIYESDIGECPKCKSSLKRKWLFFKSRHCIHPECENYYKKRKVI